MATSPLDTEATEAESTEEAPRALQPRRRSSFSVLRDAVVSATHIVEDSTELVGASVREELERFRVEMARHALSIIAVVVGGGLLTAGLAMLLNDFLDSWPWTLVIFGAVYFAIAFLLQKIGKDDEG